MVESKRKEKREVRSLEESLQWYDNWYRSHGTWSTSQAFAEAILRMLGPDRVSRGWMLDVGCGGGHFLSHLPDNVRAVGVDFSAVALREARHRFQGPLVQAAAEILPFREAVFDLIVCLGALEHFHDMRDASMEIGRVSRPDAQFLFLVPNQYYWLDHDVQPIEVVQPNEYWMYTFRDADLLILKSWETDDVPELAEASPGCAVFLLRKGFHFIEYGTAAAIFERNGNYYILPADTASPVIFQEPDPVILPAGVSSGPTALAHKVMEVLTAERKFVYREEGDESESHKDILARISGTDGFSGFKLVYAVYEDGETRAWPFKPYDDYFYSLDDRIYSWWNAEDLGAALMKAFEVAVRSEGPARS